MPEGAMLVALTSCPLQELQGTLRSRGCSRGRAVCLRTWPRSVCMCKTKYTKTYLKALWQTKGLLTWEGRVPEDVAQVCVCVKQHTRKLT